MKEDEANPFENIVEIGFDGGMYEMTSAHKDFGWLVSFVRLFIGHVLTVADHELVSLPAFAPVLPDGPGSRLLS